jgi:LuxR family maltose regulon positive regulatory protein
MTGRAGPETYRTPARKIHPPPLPVPHVPRERLSARSVGDTIAGRPVTLVSAPTGYGKSSFLAAWASAATQLVAWLTLDELDDDPRALCRGILASFRAVFPETTQAPGADDLAEAWHLDTLSHGRAVDELIGRLEEHREPSVLVLDNVDEIRSAESRAVLDRVLRYLPDRLSLVLSGRFDPPLALRNLRTSDRLVELRADDLRFSRADVQTLADQLGVTISTDEGRELHHLTEGWPVAVRMALTATGRTAERTASAPHRASRAARRPVVDLLVSDLLAGLAPEIAQFVLRACTSRRIDAELADILAGHDAGARLLAECVDQGLFIDREPGRPDEPAVYRWHDLFRAQCQARLVSSDPSAWRALHRAAARYWGGRDLEVAVEHALAGGRPALAAQLVRDQWIELVLRGEHELLLAVCLRVPPPLDEDPELLLLVAVCRYLEGNRAQADLQVRRAHARAAVSPPGGGGGRFALLESLLRVVLAVDMPDLVEMARYSGDMLAQSTMTTDETATAGAEYLVGQMLARADQAEDGVALLEASATIAASRRMTALRLACDAEISLVACLRDGVAAGRDRARTAVDQADALGWDMPATLSPAFLALARWSYERDDLDEARRLAARTSASARPTDYYLEAGARATLLEVALAAGEPAGAEALHDALLRDETAQFLPPSWPVVVSTLDARWSAAQGALCQARLTAEKVASDPHLVRHPSSLVWCADLLRSAGDLDGARAVLDRLPVTCRTAHALVAHSVVGAVLSDAQGQAEQAHRLLERALSLAEVDDLRRPFVDRATELLPLLRAHLAWGSQHAAYSMVLLDALPPAQGRAPLVPSFWSLTPREHEVLGYLRSAMTAPDIAAAVFVSVNTVKTHQRAIYRKLGVEGRREAVRVATERGLL